SGWNIDWMKKVRKSISQDDSEYNPAFVQLVVSADRVMEEGLYSVTFKNITPPGGTSHDYMSMGPYWWPDPEKPNGLPYIRRDGEVNPERNTMDNVQMNRMINSVRSLSLAWFFSNDIRYAEKAEILLNT